MIPSRLVFSLALQGYDRIYWRCIRSHEAYARRHGYPYLCVTGVPALLLASEASWLKIPLIINAMENGVEDILFVDADCEIRSSAPAFETCFTPNKCICMAPGLSGRLNAGVIMARNREPARRFFGQVLEHSEDPVPAEDDAPYENGHVIYFGKRCDAIRTVAHREWNNNSVYDPSSFIQHFSNGPIRDLYLSRYTTRFNHLSARAVATTHEILFSRPNVDGGLTGRLGYLARLVGRKYDVFDVSEVLVPH